MNPNERNEMKREQFRKRANVQVKRILGGLDGLKKLAGHAEEPKDVDAMFDQLWSRFEDTRAAHEAALVARSKEIEWPE